MRTHLSVAHAHVHMQIAILSCAYAGVRMRVAMCYQSQSARKYCFNDVRVRVWSGLGLGVEAMFNGVRVAVSRTSSSVMLIEEAAGWLDAVCSGSLSL